MGVFFLNTEHRTLKPGPERLQNAEHRNPNTEPCEPLLFVFACQGKNMNNSLNSYDILPIGIFTIDADMNIVSFNSHAETITGFTKSEALACKCFEIFRARQCFAACPLRAAMEKKDVVLRARNTILRKDNVEIPIEINISVLTDDAGAVSGAVECFQEPPPDVAENSTEEEKFSKTAFFQRIIGEDSKIQSIVEILNVASKTDAQIFITGETGTGKDVFAHCIHHASPRSRRRFIKVNCAAMPAELVESEFFGYKKGAFTDAKTDKPGRFQMAEGGTIFLDEIGELPLSLQGKLLQVLDDNTFYPLGASKPSTVDVRVISSTNRNMEKMVSDGTFRKDLFYRLKVIGIDLPPLRERPSDIPLFIDYFLREFSCRSGKAPPSIKTMSPAVRALLLHYSYPGNIRELKHIIQHACIMSQGKGITPEMLPDCIHHSSKEVTSDAEVISDMHMTAADHTERVHILATLRENEWKRQKTADALSMDRTTLWRKMKRLGLLE
jgi:PAS domain S-box-containing protein